MAFRATANQHISPIFTSTRILQDIIIDGNVAVGGNLIMSGSFNNSGNLSGNLNGNVFGNVVGNVTGNLTGQVIGNVTGNLTGTHIGQVIGNVTGNLTGYTLGGFIGTTATAAGTDAGLTIANGTSVYFITAGTETGAFALTGPTGVTGRLLYVFNGSGQATTGLVTASGAGGVFAYDGTTWRRIAN